MARTTADGFSVDVQGLDDAIKAIRRFDREAAKEVTRAIRLHAKPILAQARSFVAASRGTHKRIKTTAVALSVTSRGAALKLRPAVSPLIWAADLGMISGGMVPRKTGKSSGFATRYDRPYGGQGESFENRYRGFYGQNVTKGRTGAIMGEAVRRGIVKFERRVANDLDDLLDDVMNRAGVPRKGRAG